MATSATNLFIVRFSTAFNAAAAAWYATMTEPLWPLAALHLAGALFCGWVLWKITRTD